MTIKQLIAEIVSGGFAQYEQAGLVDHISLRTWIKNELKRFGSNIMHKQEAFLHVKNEKAILPENFWQLYLAVNCTPCGYTADETDPVVQNSLFFRERVEGTMEWDNESESYAGKDFKFIKEDYYFDNSTVASVYYNNFSFLKLVKGFNKTVCTKDCLNIKQVLGDENVNEINIIGNYVNANFKEGTIYMQYNGLEVDKEGQLIIPTTQHNRLQEYLIYYCRARILEEVVIGDDDPNKINMLSYFNQKQRDAFSLAMTETKMEALGKNWIQKVRNKTRIQTLKYDLMLPKR